MHNARIKFPVPNEVILSDLTVTYKGKSMQAMVKEKDCARKEYEKAVSDGKTAVLGEQNASSPDLINVCIGNVEAKNVIELEVT